MAKLCSVEGCARPVIARGWCVMHYYRWRDNGDPGTAQPSRNRPGVPLIDRFWSFVARDEPQACWLWTGNVNARSGYGRLKVNSRQVPAHRLAYELLVGPIAVGLEIDHVCHSLDKTCRGGVCVHRRCVNPAHLEPTTRRENQLRGRSFATVHAAKTFCVNGHPFDEENTYFAPRGERVCRACMRERQRKTRNARRKPLLSS